MSSLAREFHTFCDILRHRVIEQADEALYVFLANGEVEASRLTYAELDRQAKALATHLQSLGAAGERALLLYPSGLEFISAFFGCLYAGTVAVPAYPPRLNRAQDRLRAIVCDAAPRVVLTTAAIRARAADLARKIPELTGADWVATDEWESLGGSDGWREPELNGDSLAFLQYTSGSTALPKGVMVSHGNLLHNEEMIRRAFGQSEDSVVVGWLPLHHDMGLIGNVLQPLYVGARCILMSPLAFLQKPLRWLQAISRYRATTSGGPSFSYDLCARKIQPADRSALDLSRWSLAFNGAEPVRGEVLERFSEAFAPCGFRAQAFYPCYGLAEATLFVTGGSKAAVPVVEQFDAEGLSAHRAARAEDGKALVSCGRSWMEQQVAVVDPETRTLCAPGQVGEIWISGPSVARGYWNRPRATGHGFQARCRRKAGEPEAGAFLRSGDLGFLSEGELYLTGRLKDLIILRGRNYYPQDIEQTAEKAHPALQPGGGAAFSVEVEAAERLVVVHELRRRFSGEPAAVADAVRQEVSEEHEVSLYDVVLLRSRTIPKTSSGKIRRHACRAGYLEGSLPVIEQSRLEESLSGLEESGVGLSREALLGFDPEQRSPVFESFLRHQVARAARLPVSEVDVEQPLTRLGLDSLAAVELRQSLVDQLAVSVPLSDLLGGLSIADLVERLLSQLASASWRQEAPLQAAVESRSEYPLSFGQRALWFLHQLAPESAAYNIAAAAQVASPLEVGALRAALSALSERHPTLRTTFHGSGDEAMQRVHDRLAPGLLVADAATWSEAKLEERLQQEAYRSFDLETGPVMRLAVFSRSSTDHVVLLVMHHVISDFWSMAVLTRELGALYGHWITSGVAGLEPLALCYGDYVRWQRQLLAGPEGKRLRSYWHQQLAGPLPLLEISTDLPRPPTQTYRGASEVRSLGVALSQQVAALAQSRGVTLFMVLLAGFETLLHRYTGQRDFLVGSPTAGRSAADLSGLVGYFVNPVALRADLSGDPGFEEFLGRVRHTVSAAIEHQDYPFMLLVESLQPVRDAGRSPLFQTMFTLHKAERPEEQALTASALGQAGARIDLGGLKVASRRLEERVSQFDLALTVADLEGRLTAALQINTDLFDRLTARRMLGHFRVLLAAAAAEPRRPVSCLPMLTAAERAQLLREWNVGGAGIMEERLIHRRFEAQAKQIPDSVALLAQVRDDAATPSDMQHFTYRCLNGRANQLARYLRQLGVGPEVRVGLLLERSPEMIASVLGILKAGGAYVPFEPAVPRERLLSLLEDAGARLLVTRRQLAERFGARIAGPPQNRPTGGRSSAPAKGVQRGGSAETPVFVCLDSDRQVIARHGRTDLDLDLASGHPAYVIYTSGSTGRPKGVVVPHRGLAAHSEDAAREYRIEVGDRVLQFASISFDTSAEEIYPTLVRGATLVLRNEEMLTSGADFLSELERQGITVLNLPTAFWHRLAGDLSRGRAATPAGLRLVIIGGEEARAESWAAWRRHADPGTRLVNTYGPTEASIVTTRCALPSTAGEGEEAAIGRPIAYAQTYVVDAELRPMPVGIDGELCIGGAGLARGYLRRPAPSAESFVPDPFSGVAGARIYKTGDRVRFLAGGKLEFRGRLDQQVKVRGFRIEPGEIEAVLGEHVALREAVVTAREAGAGDLRLVAYVVAAVDDAKPTVSELRRFLEQKLPEHMIPSAFMFLEALPLTASRKIDRRALPEPEPLSAEMEREFVAPRTPLEQLVAGIWAEVLALERVSVETNFFELGGHSLLATQLVSRLREALQLELPLAGVFEAQTVALQAERVAESYRRVTAVPIRRSALPRDALPLSFAQERLWFLDQLDPGAATYNMPASMHLHGTLDASAFERSVQEVVRRHEVLRTAFRSVEGRPALLVVSTAAVALPVIELGKLAASDRRRELERLTAEEARTPFDLAAGPLLRLRLLRLQPGERLLVVNMHHIVSDGWSTAVLADELSAIYRAYRQGESSPLSELPIQYADFAYEQRQWASSSALKVQLAYWKQQLEDLPAFDFPLDRRRPPHPNFRGGIHAFRIDGEVIETLRTFGARRSATLFMCLLAAFKGLLYRYSGQPDVVVGSPVANRNRREIEPLIGFFTNTLVLRTRLAGQPSFGELLGRVREMALGAYAHQDLPFERLVEELRPGRSLTHSPFFQVVFLLQQAPASPDLGDLALAPQEIDRAATPFDLILELTEEGDLLSGRFRYQTDLFHASSIVRLARHFCNFLVEVVAAPGRSVASLPLLGAGERQQLVVEWNEADQTPSEGAVHELFEIQAELRPEAVAVVCGEQQLSYRKLNLRANRLAHHLRSLGVGRGSALVGLCVDRSLEMVVGILGILKAGGAYVPLDPAYPDGRLAFLLADSKVSVVVTTQELIDRLPRHRLRPVCLDSGKALAEESAANPARYSGVGDVAYVIYTSGTTGRPKGTPVLHGQVTRLFRATERCYGFDHRDVWTLFHSYAFDFSVWELWGALAYGGRLVIVPFWVSRSPEAFCELLAEERVTVLNQTPSAFQSLIRADDESRRELALRSVIFGGEALHPSSLAPWFRRRGDRRPRLANMYGITETTVHVTYRSITAEDAKGAARSRIGRPLADLGVFLVDGGFEPVPIGVPGELIVGGAGVAVGYLGRPGRTARSFGPDPFSSAPGARLYRSGDLGRFLAGGEIEYLGRLDHQVKIRGFRIELGEIETLVKRHAAVREALVLDRDLAAGERRLVAYVVPEAAATGSSARGLLRELRQLCERQLPEYMMPAHWVPLSAIPLTAHGKLDRRALPAPDLSPESQPVASLSPVEELVAGVWAELLGVGGVGVDDNFFELGGHSLLATQVTSRLRRLLAVELSVRQLFEAPTVSALAREIEAAQRAGVASEAPPLVRLERRQDLPLSFAQERLWFLDQLEPGGSGYIIHAAMRLSGHLDVAVLARSLHQIVHRHEALRTTFASVEGRAVQRISPSPILELPVIDLRALPAAQREAVRDLLAEEEARRPFDLTVGPLLRVTLLRLAGEQHVVLLSMHHIVSDGWSIGVFIDELGALFSTFSRRQLPDLAELPVRYADFSVWQRKWLSGEVLQRELAFWRRRLAGLEPLSLPTDRPRPSVRSLRGASLPLALPAALSESLRALSRRQGATLYMTLLAAFEVLLYRYTGQQDVAVGSVTANRTRAETEGLIGFFANTLVMRGDLRGKPAFRELLERVGKAALEAYVHQDLPFEKLVEELHPQRSLSHQPLFQVLFVLQNAPLPELELPGLTLSPLWVEGGTAPFDLTLELQDVQGALEGALHFSTDLFDRTTATRMLRHLEILLGGVVAEPERSLPSLPLLSPTEGQQLFWEWSDTATDYGRERCVHELFEAQVERRPEATALALAGSSLSYGELNRAANRLAHRLRDLGVGPEEVVGLCLSRSFDLMVGILGILKAGGAYLPLDASHPKERRAFMVRDSSVRVLVSEASRAQAFAGLLDRVVCLDADRETIRRGPAGNPNNRSNSRNLVYSIYTSGSTGMPKGVSVPHRGVVRLVRSTNFVRLGPQETFLQLTPISFDVSTLELWGSLLNGGCLVLYEGEEPALEELSRTIAEQRVSILWLSAGLFHLVVDEQPEGLAPVGQVLAGGDKLSVPHVRRLLAGCRGQWLINGYGPTENTTFTSCHGMSELGEVSSVPIGRPISNTQVVVLDRRHVAVPSGVAGELCTGGDGLARCYGNRPGLTAASFVPHPSSLEPGRRLYRTGDLARFLSSGVLEFLGRLDAQVKIRGFRVELGEIETVLSEHPGVSDVAAIVREEPPGGQRLVAYVVPAPGRLLNAGELGSFLRAKLPAYMVPSDFVMLEALPLTAHAKIDRRALPAPETARPETAFAAPRSPVEEALASMWSEVLGRQQVGIHDDFFELGGHSLLATQVIYRIGRAFHLDLPLRRLFEAPTVAGLALEVEKALGAGEGVDRAPLEPVDRSVPLPLSFAQQRLWFICLLDPESTAYNSILADRVSGDLDEASLRWALSELVRRHEVLRTTFRRAEGGPVQVVSAPAPLPLPAVDLSRLDAEPRDAELLRLASEEAGRPFDLARGPVIRAAVVRLGRCQRAVLLSLHHIVSDGWSVEVFQRELAALYQAAASGSPSPLAEMPLQYGDFAVWQRRWLQGEVLKSELAFWRQRLAGLEPLKLAVDRPRPPVQGFRGAFQPLILTTELSQALKALSRRRGVTLYMTLLAAFELFLHRHTGQTDIAVGSPIANRNRMETEGLIGFFVNTLVMRGDLRGEPTFLELLERVGAGALEAYGHQDVPFEVLVDELHPERSLSHQPLFQVLFVLQNAPRSRLALPGLTLSPLAVESGVAQFDLALELHDAPGALEGGLRYRMELFDGSTVARMGQHFKTLLEAVAADPEQRLSGYRLVGSGEQHQLLVEWNDTASDFGRERCVHELFEAQAARRPEATALALAGSSLSYGELNRRANRLAHHLRGLGVGQEEMVGLCLDRSFDLVVGMLGILKAGGAYLPLDASYPQERRAFMVKDSSLRVLVSEVNRTQAFAGLLDWVVCLDADREAIRRGPAGNPERRSKARNLVYSMYTSGSTGVPKGVGVAHRSVVRLVRATRYARLDPEQTFLLMAPVSFDASTLEVWGPLLNGGRLVLYQGEEASLEQLSRTLAEQRVTTLWLTAGLFHLMVDEQPDGLAPVRQLLAGGDKLSVPHVRRLLAGCRGLRLINGYGPTENTTFTCCHGMRELGEVSSVPIGRPISNTRVLVSDRYQAPASLGVAGELCVGGDGLARCYGNRPGLTAVSFVPHSSSPEPGRRLYRTGDLARFLTSGELEFLGRLDAQVKIRGFRVEPGEIEAVLSEHPGVWETAVIVREEPPGDRRLVAYVVPAPERLLNAGGLRDFLRAKLPAHMVPSDFVMLEALPLTAHGKIDRRALPAPETSRPETAFAAPRSPVEEALASMWSEVLGREQVGIHDDFFELGGHSLLATQVVSRIGGVFHLDLPLRRLFEAPTVATLAPEVERALGAGEGGDRALLEPVDRSVPLPLSFAQQRLWFLYQLDPESAAYNSTLADRVSGDLDEAALGWALSELVRRHEVLRTTFRRAEGGPVQVVSAPAPLPLPAVDLSRLDEEPRDAELLRLASEEERRPFDLARGPMIRAAVVRLGRRQQALLLSLHHIVSDGWSVEVFQRELAALYQAVASGSPSPLAELPLQYADFAVWQRRWLQGEVLESELAFWRQRLAGLEPLRLTVDHPRPPVQGFGGAFQPLILTTELSQALKALSRRRGVTLYMTLLAAFELFLHRHTGQTDIAVGSPIANRNRMETEGLIGFFVNTLVMRGDLRGEPTFLELLDRVGAGALEAYGHQDVPFEVLVDELHPERSLSHQPLFQVLFVLQNAPRSRLALPGLTLSPLAVESGVAQFDLALELHDAPGAPEGGLRYRTELFDGSTVARMGRHFKTLLEAVAADPEQRLSGYRLVGSGEQHQLLVEWNDTASDFGRERCVHELFEAQAARRPEATALALAGSSLSYGELNRRANRLAHHLRGLGVGPEEMVGLCLDRSFDLVVGMLGILKAGGAYLPLDASHPWERLALVLADSSVGLLVTEGSKLGTFAGLVNRVAQLDADRETIRRCPAGNPEKRSSARNLVYSMYTSGSTGVPKGVGVTHRSVVRLVRATRYARLDPEQTFLLMAPMSFDASTLEVWGPLLNGGRLVLYQGEEASLEQLSRTLAEQRVTTLWLTAGLFHLMVDEQPDGLAPVRQLLSGGDKLSVPHVRRLLAISRGLRLSNCYGPTENTTFTSCHGMSELGEVSSVPIGRSISNTRMLVSDRYQAPASLGVAGELCVGGDGLARCYGNRPGLTAASFVPYSSSPEPGRRLYRTGDLARFLPSGELEFLGRLDAQVKIRGFRVEPGEIEAVLSEYPEVSEVTVIAREDMPGGRSLVAYVVPAMESELSAGELRSFLQEKLPAYMVPSAFVTLEALPLTANGKIDRRALPVPEGARTETAYVAPRTPVEEILAAIWSEVLGIERVGVDHDFFELGGHSLVATQAVSRIGETFQIELPLRSIFQAPTVAALAAEVETAILGARESEEPALVPVARDQPLPLAFAQQRLWFLDRLQPGSPYYNMPFAVRFSGRLRVAALAQALSEIVRRHGVLRTTFAMVDQRAVQIISPSADIALARIDLEHLLPDAREAEVSRLGTAEARRPFDLEHGPVMRTTLLELSPEKHLLLLNLHHIVADGWSIGVLIDELAALYSAFSRAEASPLAPLPVQYADFAVAQRQRLQHEALEAHLSFWKQQLAGNLPQLKLSIARSQPLTTSSFSSAHRSRSLSPELAAELKALARQEGATLFMVLLAAFKTLLFRYSEEHDLVIGTPIANRKHRETEGLIGFFANSLALRTDLSKNPTFRELLGRVRKVTLDAYAHQDLPFETVVETVRPERRLNRNPLFQVVFVLQNAPMPEFELPGLSIRYQDFESGVAKFDLVCSMMEISGVLKCDVEYARELFDAVAIEGLLKHFETLLTAVAESPDTRLSAFPVVSPEEHERALAASAPRRRKSLPAELLAELEKIGER